jgi:hypothetical protein
LRKAEIHGARRGNGPGQSASFSSLVASARPISIRAISTRRADACPARSGHIGGIRVAVLIFSALLFFGGLLPAQSKPSEYAVKAAYLLNFGKFMRVSPGAKTNPNNFNICIVGEDPFGRSIDDITAGEQIDGRPVRIVRLAKPDSDKPDSEARDCAIAYFSIAEEKRMEQDVAAFHDSDTLTVSDAPDFLKRGGMIQLLLVQNHVRFSVNLDPIRRTHLNLSSELLRVAASVSGNRPGEAQP